MKVKSRSKMSHWPEIPRRYAFYFLNKTLTSNPLCWGEHQQISGAAALANILFVVHTFHFTICSVVFFKASQRFQTSNSGINSMHKYVVIMYWNGWKFRPKLDEVRTLVCKEITLKYCNKYFTSKLYKKRCVKWSRTRFNCVYSVTLLLQKNCRHLSMRKTNVKMLSVEFIQSGSTFVWFNKIKDKQTDKI